MLNDDRLRRRRSASGSGASRSASAASTTASDAARHDRRADAIGRSATRRRRVGAGRLRRPGDVRRSARGRRVRRSASPDAASASCRRGACGERRHGSAILRSWTPTGRDRSASTASIGALASRSGSAGRNVSASSSLRRVEHHDDLVARRRARPLERPERMVRAEPHRPVDVGLATRPVAGRAVRLVDDREDHPLGDRGRHRARGRRASPDRRRTAAPAPSAARPRTGRSPRRSCARAARRDELAPGSATGGSARRPAEAPRTGRGRRRGSRRCR